MSRILITGGSSYLGQHLVPLAAASHTVHYTYHQNKPDLPGPCSPLDVRDETAVHTLITTFQPDVIIHLAGSNRGHDMTSVIRLGAGSIVWAAQAVGARLIHLSTDSIFAGDAAPYDETAVPTPVNAYGRAKADAEAIVRQQPKSVIVRTSLIYGLHTMDHGTQWMADALAQGQPVTLFSNQIRNPIWVNSLCHALLELTHHNYTGVLNVAGCQALSRADFALRMLDYWQIQPRTTLTVTPSDGRWPLNCELDLRQAAAVLSTPLPGVDEVLSGNGYGRSA